MDHDHVYPYESFIEKDASAKGGIYMIIVKDVGVYYGESVHIQNRFAVHRKKLSRGQHTNHRMQAAWKSFGSKVFTFVPYIQTVLLTKNHVLRKAVEREFITSDAMALNIVGNVRESEVTQSSLPDRPLYRNKTVRIVRKNRTAIVKIYDYDSGKLLGTETMKGKFRLGVFRTDMTCRLTRVKPSPKGTK